MIREALGIRKRRRVTDDARSQLERARTLLNRPLPRPNAAKPMPSAATHRGRGVSVKIAAAEGCLSITARKCSSRRRVGRCKRPPDLIHFDDDLEPIFGGLKRDAFRREQPFKRDEGRVLEVGLALLDSVDRGLS